MSEPMMRQRETAIFPDGGLYERIIEVTGVPGEWKLVQANFGVAQQAELLAYVWGVPLSTESDTTECPV